MTRSCRVCGCTDNHACVDSRGPCWWVEADLCSHCNAPPPGGITFDLVQHLYRQRAFSLRAFGPGQRVAGVLAHIRKELTEIEAKPDDLTEWVDLILLAFNGAFRQGGSPEAIYARILMKQGINEDREWPDWRTADPDAPIEHIKIPGLAVSETDDMPSVQPDKPWPRK